MKILLTHSYFYRLDPKQWKAKKPYPPLGTLQVAAVLREANFTVDFFDVSFRTDPKDISGILKSTAPNYLIIYDDGFNYLTKMCLTVMRQAAFTLIEQAKKHGAQIIVCSSDSTDHYIKYLDHGADFVVRGEGEETLLELFNALQNRSDLSVIAGLAYKKGMNCVTTGARPVMRDLDRLPMAAWDLIDLEPYRKIWMRYHGYFSLNLATTRGCPYKCNWCAKPIYGNRYNSRSPERVVDEIEFLLKNYRPNHFWMCDDIFGLTPGWTRKFKDLILQRKLSFRFKIQSRVDLLLKGRTIDDLAQAGVETVWVGAESGSQKILDAMDKGTTIDQIHSATTRLKEKSIRAAFFLQFGYPGEKKEDIDKTLKMVLTLLPDEIGISVSYPLPGTVFYERVKNELAEKRNWKDSDDLAMMYRSTFSPGYYKILHRYIHSRYRIQKGIHHLTTFRFLKIRSIASMIYHAPVSLFNLYRLRRLSHAVD